MDVTGGRIVSILKTDPIADTGIEPVKNKKTACLFRQTVAGFNKNIRPCCDGIF
jgi:hypothetical protein